MSTHVLPTHPSPTITSLTGIGYIDNNDQLQQLIITDHRMQAITSWNYFIPHRFKKCEEQSPETQQFKHHKINVFVQTKYGRPIYVRYGDEIKCSSFLATLSTIINKMSIFYGQSTEPSKFNKIKHKGMTVYLLQRKNINYICISKINYDELVILSMLDFLNIQIISCLTDSINTVLQTNPTYDPTVNFSNHTINLLSSAIKIGLYSPCITFNSIPTLPLNSVLRNQISNLMKENKEQSLQIFLLMTLSHVIAVNKQKQINVNVEDIFILFNLLQTQKSLRNSENWLTICLPGLEAAGNLFCYTNFITENLIIVMLTDESFDMFYTFSTIARQFKEKLLATEAYQRIVQTLSKPIQLDLNFEKSKMLKHFLVKQNNYRQIIMSSFNFFGKNKKEWKQILNIYGEMYRLQLITSSSKKEKMYLQKKKNYTSGVYSLSNYTIFFCGNEFMNLQDTKLILEGLTKWIKQEQNNLFIVKYL